MVVHIFKSITLVISLGFAVNAESGTMRFTVKPQSVFFEVGTEVVFNCKCKSPSPCIIDYRHQGKLASSFKESDPIYMEDNYFLRNYTTNMGVCERKLIFRSVMKADTSYVDCLCEDKNGESQISATAVLRTMDDADVTFFINEQEAEKRVLDDNVIKVLIPPQTVLKDNLGNVTLVCQFYMEEECEILAWIDKRSNKEILTNTNPHNLLVSTLWVGLDNITNLYGEYECQCTSADGEQRRSKSVLIGNDDVDVTAFINEQKVEKPVLGDDVIKVSVSPQAHSKEKLSNVTLVCELFMEENCEFVAWVDKRRNKELLRNENPHKLLVSTLWVGRDNIKNLYGEYECQCTSADGEVRRSKSVLIGRPPVVASLREKQFVISGETRKSVLALEDTSDRTFGYPIANPMWSRWVLLRNGSWVNKEVKFEGTRFVYEGSKLVIMNTQYEDAGKYDCLIQNEFGSFSFSVSLKVIDKYAAIWPFFGLSIATIFLMVAIIFFERHTKKED